MARTDCDSCEGSPRLVEKQSIITQVTPYRRSTGTVRHPSSNAVSLQSTLNLGWLSSHQRRRPGTHVFLRGVFFLLQAVVAEDEVSDHSQSEACSALKPENSKKEALGCSFLSSKLCFAREAVPHPPYPSSSRRQRGLRRVPQPFKRLSWPHGLHATAATGRLGRVFGRLQV